MSGGASYMNLKEGDRDPNLGHFIEVLIIHTHDFIVYLDDHLEVQWSGTIVWPEYTGSVLSRISKLESVSAFIKDRNRLRFIRCQIAEGAARLLDGCAEMDVNSVLDNAETEIVLRNRETSRKWFFASAAICVIPFMLVEVIAISLRYAGIVAPGSAFQIFSASLLGSLGALGSICIRSNAIQLDANAGFSLHVIEACARVLLGAIGSFLIILLIKGGLILGTIDTLKGGVAILWALGVVAGGSERIFPGLIRRGEDVVLQGNVESNV